MTTLHILRKLNDPLAREVIEASQKDETAVLLMQDAIYGDYRIGSITIYTCREDLSARQMEKEGPSLSYDEVAQLVTKYDRTVVW
jgi:sulfur transfer complex TusBCD TusB component (DsrH family)